MPAKDPDSKTLASYGLCVPTVNHIPYRLCLDRGSRLGGA